MAQFEGAQITEKQIPIAARSLKGCNRTKNFPRSDWSDST